MFSVAVTPELVDLVPVKVASFNPDGTVRFINKTYADWLDLPREAVIGKLISDVIDVIDGPAFLHDRPAFFERLIAENGTEEYKATVRLPSRDNEVRIIRSRVVGNRESNIVYQFSRDVTEVIRSEENEAKFRAVFEGANEGIIVTDTSGLITQFNAAAERMFGYTRDEIIGQPVTVLQPDHVAAMHQQYVKDYLATDDTHKTIEGNCVRKDGTTFPADLGVARFEVAGTTYFTALIRDVTERKQHEVAAQLWNENLEAEVRRRGRTLDRIFDLSDDILGTVNFEGYFTSISPSCRGIFGLPPEEVKQESIFTFIHPSDLECALARFKQCAEGSPVRAYEVRFVNRETGETRWTQWNVQPDLDAQLLFVSGRDITNERLREEVLRHSQKMEAIGQLTGGIAHDFNNLLQAISGCVDLIDSRLPSHVHEDVQKYLDGAKGSVQRASSLTHRLLAFSRRQPLSPVPVNVNRLLREMEELINRTIGSDVEVVFRLADTIPLTACDPNQLESALINLVLNGRDALPGKTGQVIIHTEVDDGQVCIKVTDCGSGMDEETKARAFDPFFTTKPIGEGTGLGLSMLYGFIQQSGGTVEIDSVLGKGTTVKLALPIYDGSESTMHEPLIELPTQATPKRILIVEDEPIIRDLMCDALQDLGHQTVAVGDGNDAVSVLAEDKNFDLIVTDVGLPGLNGKQVAHAARELYPNLRILFVTGYAAGVTRRKELVIDRSDLLFKPFTISSLQSKVKELVETKPA